VLPTCAQAGLLGAGACKYGPEPSQESTVSDRTQPGTAEVRFARSDGALQDGNKFQVVPPALMAKAPEVGEKVSGKNAHGSRNGLLQAMEIALGTCIVRGSFRGSVPRSESAGRGWHCQALPGGPLA